MNSANLSEYWSHLEQTEIGWVHPEDRMLLESEPNTFNLDYPPPAFIGDVSTAVVIVLAANGGYDPTITSREFSSPAVSQRYLDRLARPADADWSEVAPYYQGINYADLLLSGKAAIVNACAYRSRKISEEPENRRLIKKLPSARFNRQWLLEAVLPDANQGKRLIVGKRHGLWDLPAEVRSSLGFVADPAPVSPHLSGVVLDRIKMAAK
ncbi:hypothetical protein ACFQUU_13540 [Herbaspirillum sp. GCM10030257]|uniref:hypothetical protein n=1 Tax=Herbaspirillum sp. GCM10030257 TaxID=3273393 RepID=UPI00362153FF